MKKIAYLSALALSMSLNHAVLARADHHSMNGGHPMKNMVEKLDLTAEQKEKIKAINEQARQEMKAKMEEMKAVRKQINEAFQTTPVDDSKLDSLVNQKKEVIGAMIKIKLMERRDISNVLTEQQRMKVNEMMKTWEEKHQNDNNNDD